MGSEHSRPLAWSRAVGVGAVLGVLALAGACVMPEPVEIRALSGPEPAATSHVVTYANLEVKFRRHGVPLESFETRLVSLDDIPARTGAAQYFTIGPGNHVAVYQSLRWTPFSSGYFGPERPIAFAAREAMTYVLLALGPGLPASERDGFVWVHEVGTGAIVAGSAPPGFRYTCEVSTPPFYADCREE